MKLAALAKEKESKRVAYENDAARIDDEVETLNLMKEAYNKLKEYAPRERNVSKIRSAK